MVYQILISTMYLHFSNFVLVFMIVGLVGEAVVIAEDFRPLIPPLFLSPDTIFYPAFHCEINFIEYYWGAAKYYTRENCEYDFESLKRLVPEALAGVPKQLI